MGNVCLLCIKFLTLLFENKKNLIVYVCFFQTKKIKLWFKKKLIKNLRGKINCISLEIVKHPINWFQILNWFPPFFNSPKKKKFKDHVTWQNKIKKTYFQTFTTMVLLDHPKINCNGIKSFVKHFGNFHKCSNKNVQINVWKKFFRKEHKIQTRSIIQLKIWCFKHFAIVNKLRQILDIFLKKKNSQKNEKSKVK